MDSTTNKYDTQIQFLENTIRAVNDSLPQTFINIASALMDICMNQHANPPLCQTFKELNLLDPSKRDISAVEITAANIYAFCASICEPKGFGLKTELKNAVFAATKACLHNKLELDQVVALACIIDCVGYEGTRAKKELFQHLIARMRIPQFEEGTKKIDLELCALFALRKLDLPTGGLNSMKNTLYAYMCEHVSVNSAKLSPAKIVLALKSIMESQACVPMALTRLRNAAIAMKDLFQNHQILTTLWSSCQRLQRSDDPTLIYNSNKSLIEAFNPYLIEIVPKLQVDQIVRTAWTYVDINFTNPQFFAAVGAKVKKEILQLDDQQLIAIIEAAAHLKAFDEETLLELLSRFLQRLSSPDHTYTIADLPKLAYALLIKYCQNSYQYENILLVLLHCLRKQPQSLTGNQVKGLKAICIVVRALSKDCDLSDVEQLQSLLERLQMPKPVPTRTSALQKDVFIHLHNLLANYESPPEVHEEFPLLNLYHIDLAIPSHKLAIEVDGCCHYDETGQYMPKTIIKTTILKIEQWNLLRISHMDWPKTGFALDNELKLKLLSSLLSQFQWFKELKIETKLYRFVPKNAAHQVTYNQFEGKVHQNYSRTIQGSWRASEQKTTDLPGPSDRTNQGSWRSKNK